MGQGQEWRELSARAVEAWEPQRDGDELIGVLVDRRELESRFGPRVAYEIDSADGVRAVYCNPGSVLDRLLGQVSLGSNSVVKVVFEGWDQRGKLRIRRWRVYVRR